MQTLGFWQSYNILFYLYQEPIREHEGFIYPRARITSGLWRRKPCGDPSANRNCKLTQPLVNGLMELLTHHNLQPSCVASSGECERHDQCCEGLNCIGFEVFGLCLAQERDIECKHYNEPCQKTSDCCEDFDYCDFSTKVGSDGDGKCKSVTPEKRPCRATGVNCIFDGECCSFACKWPPGAKNEDHRICS